MTQVGLSPALGAYLGGAFLANSEYRHPLMDSLIFEPTKSLLVT